MVDYVKRAKSDIFGWPLLGVLFKNKTALFLVRTFVMFLFVSALYFGFTYPSLQQNPYTTAVFWSLFWPFFMIVSLALIGPAFCGICPHGVMGRFISRFSLNKEMPKWLRHRGIGLGILLFAYWTPAYLFPDLLKSPFTSSLLFLVLTIFAAGNYYLFKEMSYCKYLCPIGSVTKGYGKMGMTQLQTYKDECSECKTFDCASACTYGLQPYLFEKRNSMRDCTLCMDCAQACEAVSFSFVRPASTLSKNINDRSTSHTWVFVLLLAVILITMRFHHGLGHSSIKTTLPWYKTGKWMESFMPAGVDWVGFSALSMALVSTFVLVFGGFYIASKIVKADYKEFLHSMSYALIPLMLISSLSHIGTFFFVSYSGELAKAYLWLMGSEHIVKPLASFKDGWVHSFGILGYVAAIWSMILMYTRTGLFTSSLKVRLTAAFFSSLIIFFDLFLLIVQSKVVHH
ncbi:4Fe-4S binding protein [Sulfurimonas sp. HSL-1716]|uniref:4Fe-4S binding protein n=1 Tax=Hydrocurvibacter sulfurireducens TaxID=3131937 RepID=UPI0031F7978C